jgi:hypothetical protein
MTTRVFRYVPYADIGAYLDLGWAWDGATMHMPHGAYAVILEWLCGCREPVEPIKTQ